MSSLTVLYVCHEASIRFTDLRRPNNRYASSPEMLQIFSIKVEEIRKPLRWTIHVFGSIAVRDVLDDNRIMVFNRERDNCQTLTNKSQVDPKAKGANEFEDRDLSYSSCRARQPISSCRAQQPISLGVFSSQVYAQQPISSCRA